MKRSESQQSQLSLTPNQIRQLGDVAHQQIIVAPFGKFDDKQIDTAGDHCRKAEGW